MNLLKCEACNGNELVKEGGFFVCQHCGCKYAPEEAKKLMVGFSGPVEIIKGSAEKEQLLEMADDCLNKGVTDEAMRLYTQVTKEFPNEWRGWWGLIQCAPPIGSNVICQNPLFKLEEVDRCVSVKPSAYLHTEYHRAISFAPDDQKSMIIHSQKVREKAISVQSAKARVNAVNSFIENKQDFLNNTAAKFQELYSKKRRNKIIYLIGFALIAIGVMKFIFDFHDYVDLLLIALFGFVGYVLCSTAYNSDTPKKYSELSNNRTLNSSLISQARNTKKSLDAELAQLQSELSALTRK